MILYNVGADWLQGHGFGEACPHLMEQPASYVINMFQVIHHRMGPIFLLAMVQALTASPTSALVFPAVMAWGVALNIAGVYLLCRWSFRRSPALALVGATVAAGYNPLAFSALNSFLCQVYGTAVLGFALAVLCAIRAGELERSRGRPVCRGCRLAAHGVQRIGPLPRRRLSAVPGRGRARWRTAQLRPFLRFAGMTLLFLLLFANIEVIRAVRGVLFMKQLNGVGWHLDWNDSGFWSFVMGVRPYRFPFVGRKLLVLTILATILFAAGVVSGARCAPNLAAAGGPAPAGLFEWLLPPGGARPLDRGRWAHLELI